jgi:hypothetical protein
VSQIISKQPTDQVVQVGDMAQMDCEVINLPATYYFQWVARTIRNIDNVAGDILYKYPTPGTPTTPNIHQIMGTYNLQVKSATLDDAGWYYCSLNGDRGNVANLIVVGEYCFLYRLPV